MFNTNIRYLLAIALVAGLLSSNVSNAGGGDAQASQCPNCGTVEDVKAIEQEGDASGVGAVAGAVAGGVLGNQIGKGKGNSIATLIGVIGGGVGGHIAEKKLKSTTRWEVSVHLNDDSRKIFTFDSEPSYRPGDKIKVVDGALVRN